MPAGVVIPYPNLQPGDVADADQVNANNAAFKAKFGDIHDGDCAAGMDFDGNKISTTPSKQVPENRLATGAGSDRVIKKDTNLPGSDALRGVGGEHIKTWTVLHGQRIIAPETVTAAMLAAGAALGNLVLGSLPFDRLKITVRTEAISVVVVGANNTNFQVITPGVAFPKATWELLALYAKNTSGSSADVVGSLHADDSGANWAGRAVAQSDATGGGTWSGTAVFMFISRT